MNEKAKAKQVVVNVTDESKAKIAELKAKYNVSDKEFVAAALVVLEQTAEETLAEAVNTVTVEKQKAKIAAKIAKIEKQLAEAKAEVE
jgi:DNA-binding MarR family transcriptional regulator